jgi:hypothetical protein
MPRAVETTTLTVALLLGNTEFFDMSPVVHADKAEISQWPMSMIFGSALRSTFVGAGASDDGSIR